MRASKERRWRYSLFPQCCLFVGLAADRKERTTDFTVAATISYLVYRLLLCWGESMLTGMLVAVFVAYRPQWMMTFRDEIYLTRR